MTFRNLMIISTILASGFGLDFLLIPQPVALLYGLDLTPDGTFIARLLGAEFIGYGLLAWFLRNAAPFTIPHLQLIQMPSPLPEPALSANFHEEAEGN